MNLKEYWAAYAPHKNAFYNLLVDAVDCGPFDGGCVLCAQALQQVLGGTIVVLTQADGRADHAVLQYRGKLWDMDGPLVPARLLKRFNRVEFASCTGFRPIQDADLPEAPRDAELVKQLADILRKFLAPEMDIKTVAKVSNLTEDNAHTKAYMLIAKRLGLPKLYWEFQEIASQQAREGGLSEVLNQKRYQLYRKMMDYAKANLPPTLYLALYQAT